MKIGELANAADVSRDTIRHYVAVGLLAADRDSLNGYQIFAADALSRLRFIKTARQLGFQLGDIKQIFDDAGNANSPCPKVRDLLRQRIAATRDTIEELSRLCDRMETAMSAWASMPDSVPDGHSVCRLIESQITQD